MRNLLIAAAIVAAPLSAMAGGSSDSFSGFAKAGSLSASGFVSAGQRGDWSVGAMNESYGFAGIRETNSGIELSTSGGSTSEGFGSNFRGFTGAAGAGGGFGAFGARGRF